MSFNIPKGYVHANDEFVHVIKDVLIQNNGLKIHRPTAHISNYSASQSKFPIVNKGAANSKYYLRMVFEKNPGTNVCLGISTKHEKLYTASGDSRPEELTHMINYNGARLNYGKETGINSKPLREASIIEFLVDAYEGDF